MLGQVYVSLHGYRRQHRAVGTRSSRDEIAIARHDTVVSEAITQFGGRVYKNVGDGVCAVFAQAERSVAAALALQRTLTTESWPTTEPLRVRIAIASGEARLLGDDYS